MIQGERAFPRFAPAWLKSVPKGDRTRLRGVLPPTEDKTLMPWSDETINACLFDAQKNGRANEFPTCSNNHAIWCPSRHCLGNAPALWREVTTDWIDG